MSIPRLIQPFWNEFHATVGGDVLARFYEAFHFDDNEPSANALAQLVLAGTKRATAGLVWSFEADNKRPPKRGDLSVVTNWQGEPLCVIETKAVATVPFEEVGEEFAAAEGEGDGSLRYWREAHWAYFGRECKRIGRVPDLRMPVFCEQFEVVYRGA
ncbi:ASCH domain-containing protein [Caenimonas soli]|uniref:ASCH domain-containing protein n=1 Tax=Caenimonas soli TaxID=2735555 RepID=UPI0015566191|nr:ASCH domain-containing protein [Caenimonas soli]NPC54108.1 ASCH domain-containing protein [Caenimonas soli]